ncbi:MAG: alpha/beta hydrolase domain-containing protein [Myxococcota bacterium]|nr:alpha/beta hydrolase domain-containing protein [Myxococcota bacterium]
MRSLKLLSSAALLSFGLAAAAGADPTSPITVVAAPEDQGERHVPATRATTGLLQDYVEEEYFVSGLADIYTHGNPAVPGEVLIQPTNATFAQTEDIPYTTRIIVRRPANVEDFTGTVVVEWWNSTAGFDTAPVYDPIAEFIAREGWAFVGITNSTTSIEFLTVGCEAFGFPLFDCQTRYAALDFPANGLAYDIVSQIAHMLKNPDDPANPLPAGFTVERLYHAGQSQQGGSMVTYATNFHFAANDAYFVQAAGSARPINFGPSCDGEGAPAYPECTPRLSGSDRLVATDLPVPVLRTLTETDVGGTLAAGLRQTDTDNFRYYEIAGASHVTVHKGIEVPVLNVLLEDWCLNEMNTLADGEVIGAFPQRAMWKNLDDFVRHGTPMPAGLVLDSADAVISRSFLGNAMGGVRTTDMDVPIARYEPNNTFDPSLPAVIHDIANLACRLSGSTFRFGSGANTALWVDHAGYVAEVEAAADQLVAERFLLPEDADLLVLRAWLSDPPFDTSCGLGFELVLVLPPLLYLKRRRKA